ncbi:hypothetical protein N7462_005989 [Penicillium macrosclerotiorum]|uniref:uncharacterized protein n=1 Tax=Penicillium macrosclerotiorum TaxID=303699 RepID=UPI0025471139|nr:uncharacterized protein N7462_005989 [Penicillium macrosclerotiorum]KAJ5682824.1 hypothetical protein N7462_005989 [Penicillium macrosclerotiorum]
MADSDRVPKTPILEYIENLASVKKGLPFGQPVCVLPSHNVTDSATLLQLAAEVGPHIAVFQLQAETIDDWSDDTIEQLIYYAKKYGFILWEGSRALNSTVNFMGRSSADWETRKTLADMVKVKYTNGPVKVARWANLATSWAPGVALEEQEKDLLIPTLRKAAREAVATTAKTIETEISVANGGSLPEEVEAAMSPPTANGWHEFSSNNLGYALRKSSTISVTESTTPEPHIQPEDGIPAPPLLSRGLSICLPSAIETAFTFEFRQSTIMAACANHDFVVGLLTSEPFFTNYCGNYLFELALQDGYGTPHKGQNLLESSPYLEKKLSFCLFSLIPPEISVKYESDPLRSMEGNSSLDETPASVTKLRYIVSQALKMRDANRKENANHENDLQMSLGPTILHVPIVVL